MMSSSQFPQIKRESLGSEDMPSLIPYPTKRVAIITRKNLVSESEGPARRVRVGCCRRLVSDFTSDGHPICPFHGLDTHSQDFRFTRSLGLYLLGLVLLAFATSSVILFSRPSSSPASVPVVESVMEVKMQSEIPSESEISALRADRDRLVLVETALREEISALRELLILRQATAAVPVSVQAMSAEEDERRPERDDADATEAVGEEFSAVGVAGFVVGLALLRVFLGVFSSDGKKIEELEKERLELIKQAEETRKILEDLKAALEVKETIEEKEEEKEQKEESSPEIPEREREGQWCRAEAGELSPLKFEEEGVGENSSMVFGGQSEKENMVPSEIGYEDSGLFENAIEYMEEIGETLERVTLREAEAMRKHILRRQQGRFSDSTNLASSNTPSSLLGRKRRLG